MSNIKILPPQIANKIAAGEVVDRPAAVVKELIENAIDAHATEIKIVLEQAGKNLIQVVDNGSGMGAEDLPLAFQRHATSKIEKVADLDKILTLGFRGEALPSIASVARIEIKSCLSGENLGTEMQLENGKIIHQEKIALKSGTTVTVRNLFYNTPARRNFLRSDVTELNHINRVLKRFFLGYPEIRFDVLHNDKEIYQLQQTNIEQRLTAVLGEELYDGMVFVREDLNDIFLEGYACRPDLARGNSENQFIFLNKRAIQNRGLNHAVLQGYGNLIERSQYPQFIIFLNTPPNFVDINVHPTKMEVRFSNERAIYHMFLSAVRKAIQTENVIPSFSLNKLDNQKKEIERKFKPRNLPFPRPLKSLNNFEENESLESQLTFSYTIPSPDNEDDDYRATSSDNLDDSVEQPGLWQMHRRYICSQIKSGLVIIDQHVAHERVLYEKFLGYLNEKRSVPSQKLLFPQTLELSLEDFLIFGEIKEWIQKIGFAFTELSGRTILIEAIPADVKVGYEGKVLLEIIDYYRDNEGSEYQPHEKIAAAFSCKNAIKSGDKLTQKEMIALVDQLFATKEPYFCPHGRPVIVTLNLEEIDRKFKRI
jgi:DNA mismatch repair protein MutL